MIQDDQTVRSHFQAVADTILELVKSPLGYEYPTEMVMRNITGKSTENIYIAATIMFTSNESKFNDFVQQLTVYQKTVLGTVQKQGQLIEFTKNYEYPRKEA